MKNKPLISYGWWVLLAGTGIQFFFSATFMNGFTVLFNPIATEFNWSYTIVSLATVFRGFEIGFLSPVVGFFVDRIGSRKLLFACACMGILGFLIFSRINSVGLYFVAFIILGTSVSLSSPVVVVPPVIKWFAKRPSLAVGLVISGSALSGLLVPGIVWSVDTWGWRHTLEFFAIGAALICIPLSLLVKDPPSAAQTGTDKVKEKKKVLPAGKIARLVMKKKNFWLISPAVALAGFAPAAVSAHQIPYLVSVGISRETAGWMVTVFMLSGLGGRLLMGWLGDIMDKRWVFVFSGGLQTAGLAWFAYSADLTGIIPSLVLLGIGVGGLLTVRTALQLDFFGSEGYAVIQGMLIIFTTIGMMAAPPLCGWVFDHYETYRPAWIILTACSLASVPLILFSRRPKEKPSLAKELELMS